VAVIAAAVELFRSLGAAEVIIGEGPGHRRDTMACGRCGLPARNREIRFAVRRLEPRRCFRRARVRRPPEIYLPNTALRADLIVSLAKMKTHHWAGATLSMKNFFGVVPGAVYGWPKNQLHLVGIDRSIAELHRVFPRSFAIVDGIVGMEGNGPIQGSPKSSGVVVMGGDVVAVDATCCRIMGIDPQRLDYLRLSANAAICLLTASNNEQNQSLQCGTTSFSRIGSGPYYSLDAKL